MTARSRRPLLFCALLAAHGCALIGVAPPPTDLPVNARCMLRVWDRANPSDASSQVDIWGTIAAVDAEKIELIEADSESVAGKPLLADPKQVPLAVWVPRMRAHGAKKFTVRRDQILSVEVLDPTRLRQVAAMYPRGTRCNIRVCDLGNPHDPACYHDVWGAIGKHGEQGIDLIDARDESITVSPPPSDNRLLSDQAREAHLHASGAGKFRISLERIISIQWLEAKETHHAQTSGWGDWKSPF